MENALESMRIRFIGNLREDYENGIITEEEAKDFLDRINKSTAEQCFKLYVTYKMITGM
jgi:hypothetical protein